MSKLFTLINRKLVIDYALHLVKLSDIYIVNTT